MLMVLGVLILVLTFSDFLQTTLGANRSGRITRVVTGLLYAVAKGLCRITGPWMHRYVGPMVLSSLAAFWVAAHWLGWVLVFSSEPSSLVYVDSGEPVGLWQRVAFIGASISTLGASLAEPGGAWWDIASTLAAVNGMVVLTLSVAFVLSITNTVTAGRAFAAKVAAGDADNRYETLRDDLANLSAQLSSFPIALFFTTPRPQWRLVRAVGNFSEAALTEPRFSELAPIIGALPDVEEADDAQALRQNVRAWVERYSLERDGL